MPELSSGQDPARTSGRRRASRRRRGWVVFGLVVLVIGIGIGIGSWWGFQHGAGPRQDPATWRASPDRFPLGTMMQGARTDLAMRLYTGQRPPPPPPWVQRLPGVLGRLVAALHERQATARLLRGWRRQVEVRVPPWVRLESMWIGWYPHPLGAYLEVEARVEAEQAGDWNDALILESRGDVSGTHRLVIPIHLRVVAPDTNRPVRRVLVYSTPYDSQATDDGAALEMIGRVTERLAHRGVRVDFRRERPWRWRDYDLVMLAEYELVGAGFRSMLDAYRQYLANGGHLVLAADAFFSGTAESANLLSEPLGLRFETRQERTAPSDLRILEDPVTEGVRALRFERHVPVYVLPGAGVSGAREVVMEPGQPGGVVAVSRAPGRGELRALGRSLWWYDPARGTNDMTGLLVNLLTPPEATWPLPSGLPLATPQAPP